MLENEMDLNGAQYSENIVSNETNGHVSTEIPEETLINEAHDIEKEENHESEPSNGLENFGLQEEGSFELFDNNESQTTLTEEEKET